MAEKRSIFEEVSEPTRKAAPAAGAIDAARRGARGAIRAWLMVIFALVVLMIAVVPLIIYQIRSYKAQEELR